ncbi:PH domain-containing protein [Micromonospora sp. KLBMP9576]|uniref:PH domain-containing protein n=1 Tax=Micromonospora sp. KLBMP9576 TaxID=3424769 RepID=UPI003D8D7D13
MHPHPTRQWRVPPALPALKLAGALALPALALLLDEGDPVRVALAVLAAAALAGWAARDLVAPVRLAVDPEGITVIRGFAGRRRLPWSAIEKRGAAAHQAAEAGAADERVPAPVGGDGEQHHQHVEREQRTGGELVRRLGGDVR